MCNSGLTDHTVQRRNIAWSGFNNPPHFPTCIVLKSFNPNSSPFRWLSTQTKNFHDFPVLGPLFQILQFLKCCVTYALSSKCHLFSLSNNAKPTIVIQRLSPRASHWPSQYYTHQSVLYPITDRPPVTTCLIITGAQMSAMTAKEFHIPDLAQPQHLITNSNGA